MMEARFLRPRRLRTSLLPSRLTQIEESNALLPLQIQVENVLGLAPTDWIAVDDQYTCPESESIDMMSYLQGALKNGSTPLPLSIEDSLPIRLLTTSCSRW